MNDDCSHTDHWSVIIILLLLLLLLLLSLLTSEDGEAEAGCDHDEQDVRPLPRVHAPRHEVVGNRPDREEDLDEEDGGREDDRPRRRTDGHPVDDGRPDRGDVHRKHRPTWCGVQTILRYLVIIVG